MSAFAGHGSLSGGARAMFISPTPLGRSPTALSECDASRRISAFSTPVASSRLLFARWLCRPSERSVLCLWPIAAACFFPSPLLPQRRVCSTLSLTFSFFLYCALRGYVYVAFSLMAMIRPSGYKASSSALCGMGPGPPGRGRTDVSPTLAGRPLLTQHAMSPP